MQSPRKRVIIFIGFMKYTRQPELNEFNQQETLAFTLVTLIFMYVCRYVVYKQSVLLHMDKLVYIL